jgi:hypothetical protein
MPCALAEGVGVVDNCNTFTFFLCSFFEARAESVKTVQQVKRAMEKFFSVCLQVKKYWLSLVL